MSELKRVLVYFCPVFRKGRIKDDFYPKGGLIILCFNHVNDIKAVSVTLHKMSVTSHVRISLRFSGLGVSWVNRGTLNGQKIIVEEFGEILRQNHFSH